MEGRVSIPRYPPIDDKYQDLKSGIISTEDDTTTNNKLLENDGSYIKTNCWYSGKRKNTRKY